MFATEAIVLSFQKHTDNTSFLHLYTREQGRIQCLVYGRKKYNFLPFTYIDVEINDRKKIPYLVSYSFHYIPLHSDYQRQCISLYMAEVMYRTIQLPMQDEEVFNFLTRSIKELDLSDSFEHLPQQFIFRLSEILGYGGQMLEEWNNLKSRELLDFCA